MLPSDASSGPLRLLELVGLRSDSPTDRFQTMSWLLALSLLLGACFLISSFFTSFGFSLWVVGVTTAGFHLGTTWTIQKWLRDPDPTRVDVVGALFLCSGLMVLQACFLWNSLGRGVTKDVCSAAGSSGDRATGVFAALVCTCDGLVGLLAYAWRDDWLAPGSSEGMGGAGLAAGGHYSNIGAGPSGLMESSSMFHSGQVGPSESLPVATLRGGEAGVSGGNMTEGFLDEGSSV